MPGEFDSKHTAEEFEKLLRPVLGAAYGVAYQMARNREDAEDLIQEATILAFRAFSTFQQGTNFKAWFYKIMINAFRNRLRKRKREPEVTPLDDAPNLYLYKQAVGSGLQTLYANPAELILSKMSIEQIQASIAALPDQYQIVAVLYFMEELSYEEIAEMIGCPIGTVRSRLHRGREMLQKALWQIAETQGIIRAL